MDNLIIFSAKYLIFVVILITLVAWVRIKGKPKWQFAAAVVIGGIVAVVFSKLAGKLYFHHRPFVVQGIKPLVAHGDDNGFPSDHTIMAATLATVLYFYHRRLGLAVFVLGLLVGISRVLARVHWPVDILAGLVLGVIAGWVGYQSAKKLIPINKTISKSKKLEPLN